MSGQEYSIEDIARRFGLSLRFTTMLIRKEEIKAVRQDNGLYVLTEDDAANFEQRREQAQHDVERALQDGIAARRKLVLDGAGVDEATAQRLGY